MDSGTETPGTKKAFPVKQVFNIAIQLLALAILISWCYSILNPFITPFVWGAVLAVAFYPMHQKITGKLKNRGTLVAVLITLFSLLVLILPSVMLGLKTADEIKDVMADYHAGKISVPAPPEKVKEWPLIGTQAYGLWTEASTGLDSLIHKHPDEVKQVSSTAVGLIASTGKGLLMIAIATIICGVFLSYGKESGDFAKQLLDKLISNPDIDMANMAAMTIRNVVKGILGVAVIQTIMAAAGFIIAGIPAAGIWILCTLILAIVQIGTLPVALGTIIYIWSSDTSTLSATLFTIWMIIVSISDNILKPILLGKGAPAPMLIVFLGAIGGFIYVGFIGLFLGAVVLTLGYKLFVVWMKATDAQ